MNRLAGPLFIAAIVLAVIFAYNRFSAGGVAALGKKA
jgi:hypothetical protein